MDSNRCPNCENDLTESVNFAIVACVHAGYNAMCDIVCPHCNEELNVAIEFSATVMRREPAAVA